MAKNSRNTDLPGIILEFEVFTKASAMPDFAKHEAFIEAMAVPTFDPKYEAFAKASAMPDFAKHEAFIKALAVPDFDPKYEVFTKASAMPDFDKHEAFIKAMAVPNFDPKYEAFAKASAMPDFAKHEEFIKTPTNLEAAPTGVIDPLRASALRAETTIGGTATSGAIRLTTVGWEQGTALPSPSSDATVEALPVSQTTALSRCDLMFEIDETLSADLGHFCARRRLSPDDVMMIALKCFLAVNAGDSRPN